MYKGIFWFVFFYPKTYFVKIIGPSLEFLIEAPAEKTKINLYNDQIYIANLES